MKIFRKIFIIATFLFLINVSNTAGYNLNLIQLHVVELTSNTYIREIPGEEITRRKIRFKILEYILKYQVNLVNRNYISDTS
jgi:hypothetical protein